MPATRMSASETIPAVRNFLELAAACESQILVAPPLTPELARMVAAARWIGDGARVRLMVDLYADSDPRLRVRMINRRGGFWLLDTSGIVAPQPRTISSPDETAVGGLRVAASPQ